MVTQLDERFVIKAKTPMNEIVDKIYEFINLIPNFRPISKNFSPYFFNYIFLDGDKLVKPTHLIPLEQSNFEVIGRSTSYNTYKFMPVYNQLTKSNEVYFLMSSRWISLYDLLVYQGYTNYVKRRIISMAYKRMVLNIIHPANIIREKKNNFQYILNTCKSKYLYSDEKKVGCIISYFSISRNKEAVSIRYRRIDYASLFQKSTIRVGTYTFKQFKKHFQCFAPCQTKDEIEIKMKSIIDGMTEKLTNNLQTILNLNE